MAAPMGRMLVSGTQASRWGVLLGTWRRGVAKTPSGAPSARTLCDKPPAWTNAPKEDPRYSGGVYVTGSKARNPMKQVGIAWAIGFPSGILLFLYAKSRVDQRRVDQMKARQRMRDSNKGEYESTRYNKPV